MTWLDDSPAAHLEAEDYPLLAAICFLPWAFGGVEIWAYRSAAFLIALSVLFTVARSGWDGILPARDRRWLVIPLLFGLLGLFQCVPLPPLAVRLLSPRAAAIHQEAAPPLEDRALAYISGEAAGSLPPADTAGEDRSGPGWKSLSLYPSGTRERTLWYLALLLAFLMVGRRVALPERCTLYKVVLLANITLLALVGVLQLFYDNGKLLWIRESSQALRAIGPYVNPNHFAGMMELAVPWLLGYSWWRFRKGGVQAFKEPQAPIALGAGLLCMAAGILAASKMAAALLVVVLLVLLLFGLRTVRARMIGVLAAVILAGLTLGLTNTELAQRFDDFSSASAGSLGQYERVVVWKAALPMVADYPLTGVGFGAFSQVFTSYVPPGEPGLWAHLHNDYLEVMIEGGLVAGLLLFSLMWAYWVRVYRVQFRGTLTSAFAPARLGMVLGLASLTVHGLVDFNHQIPGNALMYIAIAAIALHRHAGDES